MYQNDLLLFWLEKAEMNEEVLQKEMSLLRNTTKNDTNQEVTSLQKKLQDKEDEWKFKAEEYEKKLQTVEKALRAKTKQLVERLRQS